MDENDARRFFMEPGEVSSADDMVGESCGVGVVPATPDARWRMEAQLMCPVDVRESLFGQVAVCGGGGEGLSARNATE